MGDETMDNQQERPIAIDLAWLGGAWEADGSFSLNKNNQNGRYIQYEPKAQFVNTDLAIIEAVISILKRLQIGYYLISRIQTGLGSKMIHQITIQGMKRTSRFLHYIQPYVRGAKAGKIKFIVEFLDLRLSKTKNQRYTDDEHKLYERYVDYCKSLLESSTTNTLNTILNSEDRV
jgi:hypothetical protein